MDHALLIEGYKGAIRLKYDARGRLCVLDIRMFCDPNKYNWLIQNLPVNIKLLPSFMQKSDKFKLITEANTPSFDQFYTRYGLKEGRSDAAVAWNKLETLWDQVLACEMVCVYDTKRGSTAKQYPATYLNKRTFDIDINYFVKK
jgi:hypothetical protein